MVIGEDETFFIDDHAGSEALSLAPAPGESVEGPTPVNQDNIFCPFNTYADNGLGDFGDHRDDGVLNRAGVSVGFWGTLGICEGCCQNTK